MLVFFQILVFGWYLNVYLTYLEVLTYRVYPVVIITWVYLYLAGGADVPGDRQRATESKLYKTIELLISQVFYRQSCIYNIGIVNILFVFISK